ncbi:MAG: RDD family protein [Clostridium sp.]|nr:RDD family protein [Clostridium sp.]
MKTKTSSRVIALLIDNIGIYALLVGIFINLGKSSQTALSLGNLIFTLYLILVPVVFKGYHFGKYMMGMKLVTDNYNNPTILHIMTRELIKIIYTIPLVGVVLALVSNYIRLKREDGKAIHDIIARTKVINV